MWWLTPVAIFCGGTLWAEFWIRVRDKARRNYLDTLFDDHGALDFDEADRPHGGPGEL